MVYTLHFPLASMLRDRRDRGPNFGLGLVTLASASTATFWPWPWGQNLALSGNSEHHPAPLWRTFLWVWHRDTGVKTYLLTYVQTPATYSARWRCWTASSGAWRQWWPTKLVSCSYCRRVCSTATSSDTSARCTARRAGSSCRIRISSQRRRRSKLHSSFCCARNRSNTTKCWSGKDSQSTPSTSSYGLQPTVYTLTLVVTSSFVNSSRTCYGKQEPCDQIHWQLHHGIVVIFM